MNDEGLLQLEDVHAYYGLSHVLQGVTLRVPAGGVVSLMGRNGVGKTTTLKCVFGLVSVRGGPAISSPAASSRCWRSPARSSPSRGSSWSTSRWKGSRR